MRPEDDLVRIQVPSHFEHAGQLPGGVLRFDPRDGVPVDEVVIDFRYCEFVRPPGALWSLIYALLVRHARVDCVLLVPESIGVARYLQTIGLSTYSRMPEPRSMTGAWLQQIRAGSASNSGASEQSRMWTTLRMMHLSVCILKIWVLPTYALLSRKRLRSSVRMLYSIRSRRFTPTE